MNKEEAKKITTTAKKKARVKAKVDAEKKKEQITKAFASGRKYGRTIAYKELMQEVKEQAEKQKYIATYGYGNPLTNSHSDWHLSFIQGIHKGLMKKVKDDNYDVSSSKIDMEYYEPNGSDPILNHRASSWTLLLKISW